MFSFSTQKYNDSLLLLEKYLLKSKFYVVVF